MTTSISVAELKAKLSRYLARARAGEAIEVTSHRKPVARITGIPDRGRGGLAQWTAEGRLVPGDGQPLRLGPPIRLSAGAPLVSETVLDARGPRT